MKKCKLLSMFLFLAIIILPGVLWIELRVFMPELYQEYSADLGENRDKATIKEPAKLLTSGDQLIDFYNDRVPFRSLIISSEQKLRAVVEKPYEESISPFLHRLAGKDTSGSNVGQKDVVDIGDIGFLEPAEDEENNPGNPALPNEEKNPDEGNPVIDDNNPADDINAGLCEHEWVEIEHIDATCTGGGRISYACNICNEQYTETLEQVDHFKVKKRTVLADYKHYGLEEYVCAYCGKLFFDNISPKLVDESYMAPVTLNSAVLLGRFNWLYYSYGKSFDYYKGTNLPSQSELKEYSDALSVLNLACELRGKKLCVLILPNKEAVYPEYLPTIPVSSDTKRMDVIASYLAENTTVNFVYPINDLKTMSVFYTTYRAYDTHWNQMGAFIGMQSMYKALGLETTDPRYLDVTEIPVLDGDLVLLAGYSYDRYDEETESDVDYIINYHLSTPVKDETGGDYIQLPVYRTSSSYAPYDKKFVMIGDSYRTRMIPYLKRDFSSTVLAHRDNVDEVAADLIDADYIILSAVERDEYKIIATAKRMADILSGMP